MSISVFPEDGSRVEMESGGDIHPGVRVVAGSAAGVTVSLPQAGVPRAGATVILRWPATPRGRYVVSATVAAAGENRVELRLAGEPEIVQNRLYVRGGGGEPVVMTRPGHPDAIGWVHDISERSIRAHFTDVEVRPGHEVALRVQLGADVVEMPATVWKASAMRQQVPVRGPLSVEMVALYDPPESQAKIIRRYVLRHQLLMRAKTAESA
ncbi:hypothetical protein ACWT_0815 [Actinoplanes sp. SE50]|uniref:hypothetical protein n=1 Tax=unclassified Actinoplanes TaxID=2626549 RepID=UPI00023EC02F|nr:MULTISPECIES: hypothetical protein [unclassified Actinoplanes]AEV81829.1 hypothetical protein ACPL_932 [Actinoplanes sp. SE50/110]ATO80230.1 hypothetical protein ACWT_0815 [Actinoplanes sp. SE50]SLL97635.1 hypothetical protein ACSP50_0842 [Actinoplanes sp. SE50/110]